MQAPRWLRTVGTATAPLACAFCEGGSGFYHDGAQLHRCPACDGTGASAYGVPVLQELVNRTWAVADLKRRRDAA